MGNSSNCTNEKYTKDSIIPISDENLKKTLEQMKTSCIIEKKK